MARAPPKAATHKAVMTVANPTRVNACRDAAAPVGVEVALADALAVGELDVVGVEESLPTKALSLAFSTNDALTVPLLHSVGLSALPSTKLTATHYRVFTRLVQCLLCLSSSCSMTANVSASPGTAFRPWRMPQRSGHPFCRCTCWAQ